MAINIKDLKNYKKGEVKDFLRLPIDRNKKVSDLPDLENWEVNVLAEMGKNNFLTNERVKRIKLCRMEKVSNQKQFVFIYDLLEQKTKKHSAVRPENIGHERTVAQLIEKYIAEVVRSLNDSENYENYPRKYWKPAIGDKRR